MSCKRFRVNLVGDVMLGRLIDQLLPTHVHCPEEGVQVENLVAENPKLQNYDFESPWGNTLPIFHSVDLNLINLETSATNNPKPWPNKVFNYRMHPANVQCLKEARISYASLANNHTLDFESEGLIETVRTVKDSEIAFAGAGESGEEAHRPAELLLENHNEDVYHLVHVYSASDHPDDWERVPNFHLIDYLPETRNRLKNLLTSAPSRPDFKIFSVHWGPNYSWTPSDEIQNLAHFLIDECGVDLIHGHSSHHIQGVEVYNGKLIIYGCGDFVDDYAVNTTFRNDLSGIWRVGLEQVHEGKLEVRTLELYPTRISRFQTNLIKRNDPDHAWVHSKFQQLCRSLGTEVQRQFGDDGQILVQVS